MSARTVEVAAPDGPVAITVAQLRSLDVLADGWAHISTTTVLGDENNRGRVHHRSAAALEQHGLAAIADDVALLTAAGRAAVAAGLPSLPAPRYTHGTNACYSLDQCRCEPCRKAGVAYRQALVAEQAAGRPRLIDAEPARRHVRRLMAGPAEASSGLGPRRIAEVAGVSVSTITKLIYGSQGREPSRRVHRTTAEKLLKVSFADMAEGATVPAGPTLERITELTGAGFTHVELGRYLTGNPEAGHHQLSRSRAVTVATARRVARLYQRWRAGEIAPRGRLDPGQTPVATPKEVAGRAAA